MKSLLAIGIALMGVGVANAAPAPDRFAPIVSSQQSQFSCSAAIDNRLIARGVCRIDHAPSGTSFFFSNNGCVVTALYKAGSTALALSNYRDFCFFMDENSETADGIDAINPEPAALMSPCMVSRRVKICAAR